VTVGKTRNIYIRLSRAPLAEVYSSMSEALRKAQTDEIESSSIKMTPALRGLEVDGVAVLPSPGNLERRPVLERNGRTASRFQMRGLETISTARRKGVVLKVP
jgi:hypothetical protein